MKSKHESTRPKLNEEENKYICVPCNTHINKAIKNTLKKFKHQNKLQDQEHFSSN
jgi:hypothetical protein